MKFKRISAICLLLLSSTAISAEGQDTTTVQTLDSSEGQKVSKIYTLSFSSTFDTNLYEFSDKANKTYANTTTASLGLKLSETYKFSFGLGIDKQLSGDREQKMRDASLSLSRSLYKFNKDLNLSGALKSKLPLSENSSNTTGLITGVTLAPTLSYSAESLLSGLSISYMPSFTRNFYRYTTATTGSSNTQYTLVNRIALSYSFTDQIALSLDNMYIRSWALNGQYNDHFSFDQSLSFSMNDQWGLYAGHAIGGSALAVNGQESNLKLFKSNESSVYLGVSYTY
jgi:hypothetical protein